jgi:serine/threonine protein kinase
MSSDTPPPHSRLGNYELLMVLAQGGMATVYAARQLGAAGFERLVVVKRVHAHLLQDPDFYHMFRDEASMASLVRHPNVVTVTDVVESQGELFIVMEYVDGAALSSVIKAGRARQERMPPRVAVRVLLDTLAGLHAAHEAVGLRGEKLELVHRDVSPHNVIVGADGISRLIDFGIAKAAHRSTHTRSGALKGKYPYMSPEQARGLPIDRRADVFAAAACLHEALTGTRLFQGENDLDTLRRVMEAPIPEASTLVDAVPRAVDFILQRALARDPNERYQTALDFHDDLEQALTPAAPRDVRAYVERQCVERLTERRTALQGIIEGRLAPLSVRQPRSGDEASNSLRVRPTTAGGSGLGRSDSKSGSKGTQITHDAPVTPASSSRGRLGGLIALGLVAVAASVLWFVRGSIYRPGVPAASATLAPAEAIELVLVADQPIESVRADGAESADIMGPRAKVRVARWKGVLSIDAVLADGKRAHATAPEGTLGEVHLLSDASEAAAPVLPSTTSTPTTTTRPPRSSQPPAQGGGNELHPNPYGP